MTIYLPRTAWTSVPAAGARMPSRPVGTAVHWPGTTQPIGSTSQANMAARLEGYRRFHVYGRGWSDIAYQVGIDQDGRVWDLRGIERESAANGDQSVNLTYLACLFLIGPGEQPSAALLQAFADWRRDRALRAYPTATRVVGHRDIRPTGGTDCPGPITEALIKAGRLTATTTQEDDMPTAQEVAAALLDHPLGSNPATGKPTTVGDALDIAKNYSFKGWQEAIARRGDYARVAQAVLAELPQDGPVTDAQLEAALRKVLGSVDDVPAGA